MSDQVGGRDQRAQDRRQDQADDEQDQRHDQPGVAGVGLLDVVVLGRDAAEQAVGRDRVQAIADPLDRVGGFARVGVAAEDDDDHGLVAAAVGGTGSASLTVSSFLIPCDDRGRLRSALTTAVSGEPMPGGKCSSRTAVPRLELVGRVSPWPKPIVPWWVRLPSASTSRPAKTSDDDRPRAPPHQRRDPRPAARFLDARRPRTAAGRPARRRARRAATSRAGSRVKAAASITAIPIARIGPSQWVDCRSATSSTSIAAITVPPEAAIGRHALAQRGGQRRAGGSPRLQLLAVAVDQQQRVVGAGAEDQHQQQEGALGVDRDRARLDQQVGDAGRDQVGGADGEQRQQRQQRRPVDEQQQDRTRLEGRDQQRLAGFVGDLLEVGGDPAGPVT